jgi:multiple sugar transport system ATP-binding protein
MSSVHLHNITVAFGTMAVLSDISLEIEAGEFLVLLGPSGCGKSTLLNAIAGLIEIADGQVWINDRNVTWEEPKDRGIAMVFQSYALYPRMNVRQNMSFGLQMARTPKQEIAKRVARAAEMLQITPLLDRRPEHLSGGQRQRVAIGRALVRDARVFLFDEPLSNLDAQLRNELRVEIKKLHRAMKEATIIYVTHDQIEAMTLADRIVVMKDRQIQQLGTPLDIYLKPANLFVAGFVGSPRMNFIDGLLENGADGPVFSAGHVRLPLGAYRFASQPEDGRRVVLGIRPEHLAAGGAGIWRNFRAELVEPHGADNLVWCTDGSVSLQLRLPGDQFPAPGAPLALTPDAGRVSLFDKASGDRL